MSYQSIDHVIEKWARENSLELHNRYQDEEVRSVENRTGSRDGYQIWIDPPDENKLVGIHVWNFRDLRRDFAAEINELEDYLKRALEIAKSWES